MEFYFVISCCYTFYASSFVILNIMQWSNNIMFYKSHYPFLSRASRGNYQISLLTLTIYATLIVRVIAMRAGIMRLRT